MINLKYNIKKTMKKKNLKHISLQSSRCISRLSKLGDYIFNLNLNFKLERESNSTSSGIIVLSIQERDVARVRRGKCRSNNSGGVYDARCTDERGK